MKNFLKQSIILTIIIFVLTLPYFVFANTVLDNLIDTGSTQGPYAESEGYAFYPMLSIVISTILGLLGVIFVLLMIYAGYNWMTASGDESKVGKAKDTIIRAIIGLIITVGSYALQTFIFSRLLE